MPTIERIVDIFEDRQITFREATKLVRERMQEAHERRTRLTEEDFGTIERAQSEEN